MVFWRGIQLLPPLVRAATVVGMLAWAAAILVGMLGLTMLVYPQYFPQPSYQPSFRDGLRLLLLGGNLGLFGLACILVVVIYGARFYQPDGGSYPLSSWQSQLRVIAFLGGWPAGAVVVVLLLPPAIPVLLAFMAPSLLAAVVAAVAWVWTIRHTARRRPLHIRWHWAQ